MRVLPVTLVLALAALAACGKKPAPEQPAPQPEQPAPAPAPAPASTNDDSEARARAERERAAAEAAARAKATRDELAQMIHFDYDRADIRQADQALLDRKAAIIVANPAVKIRVSGHADERGSDEYNLALGNRRAAAAKRYLESKGVDSGRIEVVSYGEERPLQQGAGEDAYATNRRDEFELSAGGDNLQAPK
jgi:peptidoglycan-associated lipoprotein